MKILILALAALPSFGACTASWSNGYQYCREIVIDHTKVPSTQTNFPVAICLDSTMGPNCNTNAKELATQANGGKLSNVNGYDFIITSDTAGLTALSYDREAQNLTTGAAAIWVKIGSLSSSADTKIYLFYHNSSVTTDQSNATAVWDSNYLAVNHMQLASGNYTISVAATDSTTANPLPINMFPIAVNVAGITGMIGGGADLSGGGAFANLGPYTNFPANGGPAPFTLEGWFNVNGQTSVGNAYCFGANSATGDRWSIYWFGTSNTWIVEGQSVGVSFAGATSGWHRIVTILPSGSTTFGQAKVYVDGVIAAVSASGQVLSPQYTAVNGYSAGLTCGSLVPVEQFAGLMDELRISKIERSQDWVTTEYNNQSNAVAFALVGAESALAGTGGPRAVIFK
jgi:hypothetical protein